MYVASVTRPDISFVVSKLIRFTSNRGEDHWCALKRFMHYLNDIMDYRIHYFGYPVVLEGYSNANWILMSKSCMSRVDMFSLLAVLLFHGGHANIPS
jgi:hypothetical protein